MGVIFDETMRESEEESGCAMGGERFRVEKMQRTWEGPAMIKT